MTIYTIKSKNKIKAGDLVPCAFCGEPFIALAEDQECCSQVCREFKEKEDRLLRAFGSRETQRGSLRVIRKFPPAVYICSDCLNPFITSDHEPYCPAYRRAREIAAEQKTLEKQARAVADSVRLCRGCGKEIINPVPQQYFCSRSCRDRFAYKMKKGYIPDCFGGD